MKKLFRIILLLIISAVIFIGGTSLFSAIRKQIITKNASEIPELSTEEKISFFNENKEKFEAIKNYLLTAPSDYELNKNNFKADVDVDEVKTAAEYLFSLKCRSIKRNAESVSFKFEGLYSSCSIICITDSKTADLCCGNIDLGDNWWYTLWPYPDDRIEPMRQSAVITIL